MQQAPAARAKVETFRYAATILTAISGFTAIFFCGVVVAHLFAPCDAPLNAWLIGAILFSMPATYAADQVKKRRGFQATLWFEISLLILGFIWMALGTVQINMSTTCEYTSPVVWWSVFVTVTTFWCWAIGGIFFLLVVVLVPMFLSGGRNPQIVV